MAEGRCRDEWDRAAALLTMTHNVHCSKRTDQKEMRDFHPYMNSPTPATLGKDGLRAAFEGFGRGRRGKP